ncbi:MAG: hypothetical protein A2X12_05175 [Bacteroidetes bacterium GWE2_29_8]|nr:MAG: hypothetical protein A2X12_05175 [Bacteroidetes bacterium GWE2_29_8]OFY21712.1 MAG: hypothetical protein A2X02_04650 [Bacteroidetes bacterium GWF2_29_10]
MNIIDKIKYRLGYIMLNKELENLKRDKVLSNLKTAKKIGILYYLESEKQYNVISDFVKSLQEEHKTVKALGMIPEKTVPHYCFPKIFYDYITVKDLNWYYKPNAICVRDFINTEYDILIDLTTENSFTIEYISALSKAKLKVGKADNLRKKYYDIMIDIEKNKDLKYLILQITHYLSMLKK